jgi:hypothetical protein
VKNVDFSWDELKSNGQLGEGLEQQELQPADEAPEVVASGSQDGIYGVARR